MTGSGQIVDVRYADRKIAQLSAWASSCRYEPFLPRPSDRWREYKLTEELGGEFLRVDEVPYVRLGVLKEDLFLAAKPIRAHSHVVSH